MIPCPQPPSHPRKRHQRRGLITQELLTIIERGPGVIERPYDQERDAVQTASNIRCAPGRHNKRALPFLPDQRFETLTVPYPGQPGKWGVWAKHIGPAGDLAPSPAEPDDGCPDDGRPTLRLAIPFWQDVEPF